VLESSHKRLVEFRENLANISDKHAKDLEVKDQEIQALKQNILEKDATYKVAQTLEIR
jgi:flagellar motility protein MotE (MotC chaperone)